MDVTARPDKATALVPETGRAGRPPTFEELFSTQFLRMVRLASLLGCDDPEDVAQEAFSRLYRKHKSLRDPHAAIAYLRKTVLSASNSRLRHLYVVRRRMGTAVPIEDAEQLAHVPEDHRDVLAAVASLPLRQRQVIVLRYWVDLSETDIAELLGIAEGTVKSTAAKARKTLETRLDQEKR